MVFNLGVTCGQSSGSGVVDVVVSVCGCLELDAVGLDYEGVRSVR